MAGKQSTPELLVEMEHNHETNTDHPLQNITLTISPTKRKLAARAQKDMKENDKETDCESDSSGGKNNDRS